jgi:1-acyl-sn-glycerol-3-phosphate acyltransferase
MIRAIFAYAFTGLYVLVTAPVSILWTAVSKDTRPPFSLGRCCLRIVGFVCGVRVAVRGRDKVRKGENYLFLSNHQSNCDAPVLYHTIPLDLRAVIKQEVMKLPLLSVVLRQSGFVAIDRTNPSRARAGIDKGAERLRQGMPFFAFPEGTRSRDGRLGDFKKGVFIMAIKAGVPVIPVTIRNSNRVQAPGEFALRAGTVEVTIHDPIVTAGMTLEDRDRLVEMTRSAIGSALNRDN